MISSLRKSTPGHRRSDLLRKMADTSPVPVGPPHHDASIASHGSYLRFDGETGFLPRLEPAVEMSDPGVAEFFQHRDGKRGAAAGGAVEDDPAAGIEGVRW